MCKYLIQLFIVGSSLLFSSIVTAPTAGATPGMVSANGCHGHPRHCHSRGELRTNSAGRHYVAGNFHGGHKARRHRH
jgi:hypothetical protein